MSDSDDSQRTHAASPNSVVSDEEDAYLSMLDAEIDRLVDMAGQAGAAPEENAGDDAAPLPPVAAFHSEVVDSPPRAASPFDGNMSDAMEDHPREEDVVVEVPAPAAPGPAPSPSPSPSPLYDGQEGELVEVPAPAAAEPAHHDCQVGDGPVEVPTPVVPDPVPSPSPAQSPVRDSQAGDGPPASRQRTVWMKHTPVNIGASPFRWNWLPPDTPLALTPTVKIRRVVVVPEHRPTPALPLVTEKPKGKQASPSRSPLAAVPSKTPRSPPPKSKSKPATTTPTTSAFAVPSSVTTGNPAATALSRKTPTPPKSKKAAASASTTPAATAPPKPAAPPTPDRTASSGPKPAATARSKPSPASLLKRPLQDAGLGVLTTFPRKLRGPVKGRSGASFLMGVDDAGQAREMCEEQAVAFHSVLPPLGALPSPLLVTLHEARLFWLALHAVMHCRDSHFKRYPYIAYQPLPLYTVFCLVMSKGGYMAITPPAAYCPLARYVASLACPAVPPAARDAPPPRIVRDERGTDVPWSSAWEEVYATLNLDPEERVPSRRIRVMRAYEEFLLRLELALLPIIAAKGLTGKEVLMSAVTEGVPSLLAAAPVPFLRCCCGHSHEWPVPWDISCVTCKAEPLVQCGVCGCVQHKYCCFDEGWVGLGEHLGKETLPTVTHDADKGMDYAAAQKANPHNFANFVCEVCGPALWRPPLRRKPMHEQHNKLMGFELPALWVCQRKFRKGTEHSDYYILRHQDVFLGTSRHRVIRSVSHLEEVLKTAETSERRHGRRVTKAPDGTVVVETPEENIDWAMVPQQALQGVALFRSAVVGPCKPIHLGQLIDVEADGVWAPAVVTGLEYEGEGKVQARLYGPPLGPHITVPVAHTRKHSGPFVASTDLSGGTEPVPIPCVNEVDAACPHEEDFEYSRVCVPLVAAPPPDVPCACVCGPGTGCLANPPMVIACACMLRTLDDLPGPLYQSRNGMKVLSVSPPGVIYECGAGCVCGGAACDNIVTSHGIQLPLTVFRTPGSGWGVRCSVPIPRGAFVCEYTGEVMQEGEASRRGHVDDNNTGMSYLFDLDRFESAEAEASSDTLHFSLDGKRVGNVARFINHSCAPNLDVGVVIDDKRCTALHRLCLFASRDIPAGEELCYDYRYDINTAPGLVVLCNCGAPTCRGRML